MKRVIGCLFLLAVCSGCSETNTVQRAYIISQQVSNAVDTPIEGAEIE